MLFVCLFAYVAKTSMIFACEMFPISRYYVHKIVDIILSILLKNTMIFAYKILNMILRIFRTCVLNTVVIFTRLDDQYSRTVVPTPRAAAQSIKN